MCSIFAVKGAVYSRKISDRMDTGDNARTASVGLIRTTSAAVVAETLWRAVTCERLCKSGGGGEDAVTPDDGVSEDSFKDSRNGALTGRASSETEDDEDEDDDEDDSGSVYSTRTFASFFRLSSETERGGAVTLPTQRRLNAAPEVLPTRLFVREHGA
ncbi:unnamed protein product [Lota lota]